MLGAHVQRAAILRTWRLSSVMVVAGAARRARALAPLLRAHDGAGSVAIKRTHSTTPSSIPAAKKLDGDPPAIPFEHKLKRLKLRPAPSATSSTSCSTTTTSTTTTTSPSTLTAMELLQELRQHSLEHASDPIPSELVDSFARRHSYLRISLTEKCNLRCQYCMPEEGVPLTPSAELLSKTEIVRLVRIFAQLGVNKIRFTGGEPLVRKDIDDIMHEVGAVPGIESMAITTNGITLPRKLAKLQAAGLKDLNISLDTLQADKFTAITRRLGHERVLESVSLALQLGFRPVKVNCVVMRGVNDDEILDFVEWTRDKAVDVRFIEYMPFDGNQWNDMKLVPYHELLAKIQARYELVREQDGPNATAKTWRVPGYEGSVSFITSMTEHFCSSCNRVRLTADGNFKVCLFGPAEVSLRDAMRAGATDDEIKAIVCGAVGRKKASHAGMYNIAKQKNRPMILIGG